MREKMETSEYGVKNQIEFRNGDDHLINLMDNTILRCAFPYKESKQIDIYAW